MYIASHTFGNISGHKIPNQELQKLYRHTFITRTITTSQILHIKRRTKH